MRNTIYLIAIIFGASSNAIASNLCSQLFAETQKEISIGLGERISAKNKTTVVDNYFHAEFYAKKVFEVEAGSRLSDIQNIPSIRKNTDRLDIEKVMTDFSLTRFQAVEVQAILRNHANPPNDRQFLAAVKAVRNGETTSKLNQEKIKNSPFTLALDIDGTLLDQDSNSKWIPNVHDKSFLVDGKKINHVALNPGAMTLIKKAKELGGAVVLFSRNNDLLISQILDSIQYEGVPLAQQVDGVLTSSHMTVPESLKYMIGKAPISKLVKKDLRIIESERVLLIDDNPDYVLQQNQLRVVTEFSLNQALTPPAYEPKYGVADSFDSYSSKEFPSNEPSKHEMEKIDDLLRQTIREYKQVENELAFLAQEPTKFKDRQIVFSPLGREALNLLTDQNPDFTIGLKKPMKLQEAFNLLLSQPQKVQETLKLKRKKEKPKPIFKFWGGGDDIGD